MKLLLLLLTISLFKVPDNGYGNDTIFVNNYSRAVSAKQNKVYRDLKKKDSEFIPESSNIWMIPTLSLKNDIEWDYDNFENNARYAEWDHLDIKKLFINYIIVDNGSDVAMYSYTTLFRGYFFHHYFFKTRKLLKDTYDTFTKAISEIKPDGIFEVANLKGWFIIIDNHIYFLDIQHGKAIITDDALEQIRKSYIDPYYMPIIGGWYK